MNIEELAKDQERIKQPAKKKGYDDVEISDLSDLDDEKKQSKRKDVKVDKKKNPKDPKEGKPKTLKKEVKEKQHTAHGPAPAEPKAPGAVEADAAAGKGHTPQGEEEKNNEKPANVVVIPKFNAPTQSTTTISEKEKVKKGCCALM